MKPHPVLSLILMLFLFGVQFGAVASPPRFERVPALSSSFYLTEWSKWQTDDKIEYRYELGYIKTPWVEWINHTGKTITKFKMTTACDDDEDYTYINQDVVQFTLAEEHEKALVDTPFRCEVVKVRFSDLVYEK